MIDPLAAVTNIASSGLKAQSMRMRIVAENLANMRSTGSTAGSEPYSRKTIQFTQDFDRALGVDVVKVKNIGTDKAPFRVEHEPGNPAADADGNVKYPNVNMTIEMADMRESSRSYSANLQMMKQARSMVAMTIDLLRNG